MGIETWVIPILNPTLPVTDADSNAADDRGYPKNIPLKVPIAKVTMYAKRQSAWHFLSVYLPERYLQYDETCQSELGIPEEEFF